MPCVGTLYCSHFSALKFSVHLSFSSRHYLSTHSHTLCRTLCYSRPPSPRLSLSIHCPPPLYSIANMEVCHREKAPEQDEASGGIPGPCPGDEGRGGERGRCRGERPGVPWRRSACRLCSRGDRRVLQRTPPRVWLLG